MYRYVRQGLRGARLRVSRAASGLCTTKAWLREFFAAAAGDTGTMVGPTLHRPPSSPSHGHARADRLLEASGL